MLSSVISTLFTMRFLLTIIRLATPILFAALGAFIAASTGIGNIAIESIMTFAALAGVLGSYLSGSAWVGVLLAIVIGIFTVMLIAFFSMKLGADAFLIMIALNTFADAVAIFILYQITGDKGTTASLSTPILGQLDIPLLNKIPILGEILSDESLRSECRCGKNSRCQRRKTPCLITGLIRCFGCLGRCLSFLELPEDLLQRNGLRSGLDGCCCQRYRQRQLLDADLIRCHLCGLPCCFHHLQLELRIPDRPCRCDSLFLRLRHPDGRFHCELLPYEAW